MRGCGVESLRLEQGLQFPSISIGPFAEENLLRMAELTRDFHPVRLVPRVAKDAGHVGLLLHPTWISGLSDAGIRTAFSCCRVMSLAVSHRGTAVHLDILSLELACQEQNNRKGELSVSFCVKNQRGSLVAEGVARILLNPPQRVTNVSRETSDGLS